MPNLGIYDEPMKTYKHHLYPRYMARKGDIPAWGDPNIVIKVSFNQHLMFHWCNYQLWGNLEDKVAYSVMLGKKEEGQILASKIANLAYIKKFQENPEFRDKVIRNLTKGVKAALNPEAKAKRKGTMRKNNHSQGHLNSQYGTMWITNGSTNKKIKRGDSVPEGFRPGRVNGNKKLPLA